MRGKLNGIFLEIKRGFIEFCGIFRIFGDFSWKSVRDSLGVV